VEIRNIIQEETEMAFQGQQSAQQALDNAVERGDVPEIPGITVGYEPPEQPDAVFDTSTSDLAASVDALVALLRSRGAVAGDPAGRGGAA
jgi:adenylylsulfate kinase-like enzyme